MRREPSDAVLIIGLDCLGDHECAIIRGDKMLWRGPMSKVPDRSKYPDADTMAVSSRTAKIMGPGGDMTLIATGDDHTLIVVPGGER